MSFPSRTTASCQLKRNQYDLRQLLAAVKNAEKGKLAAAEPVKDTQFHAHTYTVEALLETPEPFHEYPDGPRPNPDAETFEAVRDKVMQATEAGAPLQLSHSAAGMLHVPFDVTKLKAAQKAKLYNRSPDVHLPGGKKPIVNLPGVHFDQGRAYFASNTAWDTLSWLHAALALDPSALPTRKTTYRGETAPCLLRTRVAVIWTPPTDEKGSPMLSFVITIDAYLNMDAISSPLPLVGDDLRRMVLVSIMPKEFDEVEVLEHRFDWDARKNIRAAALNALYDSMEPAPALLGNLGSTQLQPPGMNCRLLPFQQRTLALMLSREGAPIAGPIISRQHGQWVRYKLGEHGDYAFHRLTGELKPMSAHDRKGKARADVDDFQDTALYPRLFDSSHVQGTLLCEEMGLGKTVEAIALMMLHRHPLSVPRPLSDVIELRQSAEVSLVERPADFDHPELKEWLARENAAFSNARSWSEEAAVEVSEVAATLVVTPTSLLRQWVAEIGKHAPCLRVGVYPGWKPLINQVRTRRRKAAKERERSATKRQKRQNSRIRNATRAKFIKGPGGERVKVKLEEDESGSDNDDADEDEDTEESLLDLTQRAWIEFVRGHDIIITTYQLLADDLAVAKAAPKRNRRSTATYNIEERPRSPLVMAKWWRVIMDEVQLHSDASAASKMVSLIPRNLSLAMSGTPAKSDVHDLMGSLRFLRLPVSDRTLWHRLVQDANRPALHGLIKSIAVRTLKAQVSDEFHIPPQTRYVIPVQLSDIELHYYEDTLARQRELLSTNSATFRLSLRQLRQICTHIQVGALQRGAMGGAGGAGRLHLGNELMTMEEALAKMSADHKAETVTLTRNQMRLMVRKAQLIVMNENNPNRLRDALALYESVRHRGGKLLETARERLALVLGDGEDTADDEIDKNASQADRDHAKQISVARMSIRETLLVLHQSWFFEGDARHQMGEEGAEVDAYNNAESIRKEILSRPKIMAERSIAYLTQQLASASEPQLDALQTNDTSRRGGLATSNTISEINSLLHILNDNAVLVLSWRDKLVDLLKQPVEAEDDAVPAVGVGQTVENPEEEYYAQALKVQGDISAYLWAYAAAVGDRREILLEERTLLNEHEGAVIKKRTTKRAQDAAADAMPEDTDEVAELMSQLHTERQAFRDRRVEEQCTRPLKALLISLGEVAHSGRSHEEVTIAQEAAKMIRRFITAQTEMISKLNKELDLFRATYNKRVVYFAALQEISDSVAAPLFRDLHIEIEQTSGEILEMETILGRMAVRARYLKFLGSSEDHEREDCTICFGTSDDKFAVLLDCGHAFCVSCFREYRKSPYIGSRCATCKTKIPDKKLTRIRIKKEEPTGIIQDAVQEPEPEAAEEEEDEEEALKADEAELERRLQDLRQLNYLPEGQLQLITGMDMMGDYGSKINVLIKHLKLYRIQQPDVRHVVFSNWADSLHIVEQALRVNHIRYVSLDANSKKNDVVSQFHSDPTIAVFLLHAERESAGLTLTSCGAVHLLEPVLQHSFELQAIGRVDRLGQTQNTSVYCYATMDTVESRILSQGVRNGTSIYLADKKADEEAMSRMPHVAHAAGNGGDISTVKVDDELIKLIF